MKPYSLPELKTFIEYLNQLLVESQLQDVISHERGLALDFYKFGHHYWLICDLVNASPMMLIFQDMCPFLKAKKQKPVGLFLNSHAVNLEFKKIELDEKRGRIVLMSLSNSQKNCQLELHLIPKQANLIVRAEKKNISWERPKDLSMAPQIENYPESRSVEQIHQEWLSELQKGQRPPQDPAEQWEKKRKRDLEKKQKAMLEIQQQLAEKKEQKWFELGELLKTKGPQNWLDLKTEWTQFLNTKKSYAQNLENAFSKAKQLQAKQSGTLNRLELLQKEIFELQNASFEQNLQQEKKSVAGKKKDLLQAAEAKGRTLRLESGAIVYMGKSASDNLAILRTARAWDYWLHLRDYPGAHAIIHREKNQEISSDELKKVAVWLAQESLSKKSLQLGQKLNVLFVECRFVRPIKGDKLGRVNYHSEKNFVCHLDT